MFTFAFFIFFILGKLPGRFQRLCSDFSSDDDDDGGVAAAVASYRPTLCSSPAVDPADGGGVSGDVDQNILRDGSPESESLLVSPSNPELRASCSSGSASEAAVVSGSELSRLLAEFQRLKMTFLVRCKYPICSQRVGPLQELWQNNLIVREVVLRRMQCMSCKER